VASDLGAAAIVFAIWGGRVDGALPARREIPFDARGLCAATVEHAETGAVLSVGFLNAEAAAQTFATGHVHFYSRSARKVRRSGASTRQVLIVRAVYIACEGAAVLIKAVPVMATDGGGV
jgi:phosphoribosyl-AMP cyclohydrolase